MLAAPTGKPTGAAKTAPHVSLPAKVEAAQGWGVRMPSLQGHKFINRERPRSQKPDNGLAYFASSGQAPQPVQRELLPMLLSRGFEESRPLLLDTRQWHELNPLLKRAESRPRSTTDPPAAALRRSLSAAGSLERVGTMQRAGSKQLGSRKSLYGETGAGGGAGGASDAAIDERVRQKLGQRPCSFVRPAGPP